MGDLADDYREIRHQYKLDAKRRRDAAIAEFPAVRNLAKCDGLNIRQVSDTQYQFDVHDALLNFYPGNQRLYWDRNKPIGPFLHLPSEYDEWTLMAVLNAIKKERHLL